MSFPGRFADGRRIKSFGGVGELQRARQMFDDTAEDESALRRLPSYDLEQADQAKWLLAV